MLVDGLDFTARKGDYREVPGGLYGLRQCRVMASVPCPATKQDVLGRGFPGDAGQHGAKYARHFSPQLLGHTEHQRTARKYITDGIQLRFFRETQFGLDQLARPAKRRGRWAISHYLQPVMPSPLAQSAQPLKSFGGEFQEHLRRGRDLLDSHNVS